MQSVKAMSAQKIAMEMRKGDEESCVICQKEEDSGRSHKVRWIDCDVCQSWAHEKCAQKAGWRNVRRKSWLCVEHKDV